MKSIYIESPIDGVIYCKTNGQFTKHLRKCGLTYRDYFEIYVTKFTPLCRCNRPLVFIQSKHAYAKSCGNTVCVGGSIRNTKQNWTDQQRAEDSIAKKAAYKKITKEDRDLARHKAKLTAISNYGENWREQQVIKSKETKKRRYGDENYNNPRMISETNMSKDRIEKDNINERRRQTNLIKYNCEHVGFRNRNVSKINRGNASITDYTMPSGKIVGVRGFEPYALAKLVNDGYGEDSIIVHDAYNDINVPIFSYKTCQNRINRYYPDIYIPSENRIIEIKSEWWWDGYGDMKYKNRLEHNLRKWESVIDRKFKYEVWIFKSKYTYTVFNDITKFRLGESNV